MLITYNQKLKYQSYVIKNKKSIQYSSNARTMQKKNKVKPKCTKN